jgi:hypothetical protein
MRQEHADQGSPWIRDSCAYDPSLTRKSRITHKAEIGNSNSASIS